MDVPKFKLIIVGDSLTGKSTLARRLSTDTDEVKFRTKSQVYKMHVFTNQGSVSFSVHVPAAKEFLGSPQDSFFKNSHCAIILFDLLSPNTFECVSYWHRRIRALNGNIPIALCGNKADVIGRKVDHDEIISKWGKRLKYYETSAKTSSTIYEPILHFTEKLLKRGPITEFTTIPSEIGLSLGSLHRLIDDAQKKNVIE